MVGRDRLLKQIQSTSASTLSVPISVIFLYINAFHHETNLCIELLIESYSTVCASGRDQLSCSFYAYRFSKRKTKSVIFTMLHENGTFFINFLLLLSLVGVSCNSDKPQQLYGHTILEYAVFCKIHNGHNNMDMMAYTRKNHLCI